MPNLVEFEAIAQAVAQAVLVCDPEGRVVYANNAAGVLAGRSEEALRGQLCCELLVPYPALPGTAASPCSQDTPPYHEWDAQLRVPGDLVPVHVRAVGAHNDGALLGHVLTITDARDQAAVLRALRTSEERYRMLFERSPGGLFHYDLDLRITDCNDRFVAALQSSREKLIGLDLKTLRDQRVVPALKETLQGRESLFEGQYQATTSSARPWLVMRTAPLYGPDGEVSGGVGIIEDISARKQAEEEAQWRQQEMAMLLDSLPGYAIFKGRDGRYITANLQFCTAVGTAREEIAGRTDHDLFPELLARKYTTDDMRLFESGQPLDVEEQMLDRGVVRVVATRKVPVTDASGAVTGLIGLGFDITDRKHAEEALRESEDKFRTVFNNARDGIFIYDLGGYFVEVNDALCKATGLEHEQLLGRGAPSPFAADFQNLILRHVGQQAGEAHGVFETTQVRHDGSLCPVEISGRTILYGGRPAVLASVRDISARKRAEDGQRLAAVGQLAAGIAHEFNNLLSAMMMKAELADMRATEKDYEELTDVVMRATRRGSEICQNLTAFAHPRAPKTEQVAVEESIEAALAVAVREVENVGVTVEKDYQSGGALVSADRAQLEQVFLNLIINACHAMEEGGTLRLSTRLATEGGGPVEVCTSVRDSGAGIPPEHLSRVFEPFFTTKGRLGHSDTPGTGLGLSVSHGIVQAHGGSIEVSSSAEHGTTFTLRLPALGADSVKDSSTAAAETGKPTAAAATLRVLVVDDEPDIRELVGRVLETSGCEVLAAPDATAAAETLARERVDVVLADWLMPGGGGKHVAEVARVLGDPPVVVVMTGKVEAGLERELQEVGITRRLQKPFRLSELMELIHELQAESGRK